MAQFNDALTNILGERMYRISMVGTGNGTVPTLSTYCKGITLTWTATGRISVTFTDNPGTFLGLYGCGFRDATQANVKGWTCTAGTYTLPSVELDIWNSTFAAADLATTSYLDVTLVFTTIKGIP